MSTFEKRAREDKRDQKAREKQQRRQEKRFTTPAEPEIVSAADIIGHVPSVEEVMHSLSGGARESRQAAPLPTKLFVGSLSNDTTSAHLRAAFAPYGELIEAVLITDRDTGASRNFGFVTMADRKDAPAAIRALDRSELNGSTIVVSIATERR